MWNEQAVIFEEEKLSYDGLFVTNTKAILFQRLLSDWLRRGQSFLDIGCASGYFSKMLWGLGFDLTCLDNNEYALDLTKERLGVSAEYMLAAFDHLPYDDNNFDYASLFYVLDYEHDIDKIIQEAARVAENGLILSFFNKYSLANLRAKGRIVHSPLQIAKILKKHVPDCSLTVRSILPFSDFTWNDKRLFKQFNRFISILPFFAYVGIRADFKVQAPLTGLPLRADRAWLNVQQNAQVAMRSLSSHNN